MKIADFARELLYPLTDMAIVLAMLFYWILFGLAQNAGLFGIALFFLTLPAYLRYLLYLLEARANGKSAPVPEITMFNPADNFWSLTPLILIAVGIWAGILLVSYIALFGVMLIGVAILVVVPASMGVLAVTHSPAGSLNPVAMVQLIRVCGAGYFVVPATQIAMSGLFVAAYQAGVPLFLIDLGTSYQIVLLFTMTGAVLFANDVAIQVDIEDPLEPTADKLAEDLNQERQRVANHAYGFISRGNRDGGFAHIRQWLEQETYRDEAYQWFFQEMLKWESRVPALFFAQGYLRQLLIWNMDREALKLISRCLHEDPQWLPKQEDRAGVRELLVQHGREDLLANLTDR